MAKARNESTRVRRPVPRKRSSPVADYDPGPRTAAGGTGPTLKAFSTLEMIAGVRRPVSISELAGLLQVPKPTMHRIVRQLDAEHLLQRDPQGRRYEPGPRLLDFALNVIHSSMRAAPRRAILEALSAKIGETCNFGVMVGNAIVYLDRVEAAWPFGLKFDPGSRVPLHCTSMGKLFLGMLPRSRSAELIGASSLYRYTETTITDREELLRELDRIRAQDFAVDNQEFLAGVICLAVPVRDEKGVIRAALAVSAPQARMPIERALEHVPTLRQAAEDLAVHLGQIP